jgi:Na+/H+ antiporter NhaD/arsenite permease-like protein
LGAGQALDLPLWSGCPFLLLLLTIALAPIVAPRFWHSNVNRACVAALFAVPAAGYLLYFQWRTGQPTVPALVHELGQYASFIVLLGSLYTVSGGIVVRGDLRPTPWANAACLAFGAALANLIGTTGASVVLVRPLLRINRSRQHIAHLPVFFIFTVGNLGGLLTPLGDPPLFLGFLNGVPFFWTLSLWPHWLVANGLVLAIFLCWDSVAWRRESTEVRAGSVGGESLRIQGLVNVFFLGGIVGAVLIQGALPGPGGAITAGIIMALAALLSLGLTPRSLRQANDFTWGPILEVAILFAGIFVTMVPALDLLADRGPHLGVSRPWAYFWVTGLLSACLDNAPTYVSFATLAAGSSNFGALARGEIPGGPLILQAISCGAVFMGALTYIGNGPNFMVKAIADHTGCPAPSFLAYLVYSCAILLPVLGVVTFIFFVRGPA